MLFVRRNTRIFSRHFVKFLSSKPVTGEYAFGLIPDNIKFVFSQKAAE